MSFIIQQIFISSTILITLLNQHANCIKWPRGQALADGSLSDIDRMISRFIHPDQNSTMAINNSTINPEISIQNNEEEIDLFDQSQDLNRIIPYKEWFKYQNKDKDTWFTGRNGHCAVLYQSDHLKDAFETNGENQFMIVFGGVDQKGTRYSDLHIITLPSFKFVNPEKIKQKIGGLKPSDREGHTCAVFGDKMFVFGGEDTKGNKNDVYTLDLVTMAWQEVKPAGTAPSRRSYHSSTFLPRNALSIGSSPKMVIFGGYTNTGFSNELYFLDLYKLKWERPIVIYNQASDLPRPRQGAGLAYGDGQLWVFGGFQSGEFYNDFFSLDLQSYQWELLSSYISTNFPSARQFHSMTFLKSINRAGSTKTVSSLYISGGCNYYEKTCYNDLYQIQLTPVATISTQLLKQDSTKNSFEGHTVLAYGDLLVSLGGCDTIKEECYNEMKIMRVNSDEVEEYLKQNKASSNNNNETCSNHGSVEFNFQLGYQYCRCDQFYQGYDCSQDHGCPNQCSINHGQCLAYAKCSCYAGFFGDDCAQIINGCGHNNCSQETNGGQCISKNNGVGQCKCNQDRYGPFCQYYKNQDWNKLPESDQRQISLKQVSSRIDSSKEFESFFSDKNLTESLEAINKRYPEVRSQIRAQLESTATSTSTSSSSNIFTSSGDSLQDCKNECYSQGFCRDYTCYCFVNYTGKYCQETVDHVLNDGIDLKTSKFFLLGGLGVGLIIGIIMVNFYHQRNKGSEYKKFE